MHTQNSNSSSSSLLIVLIFLIPALILARGIYDIHVKKTGIAPLVPVSKADFPSETVTETVTETVSEDCEAEAEAGGGSDGCP